MSSFNICSEALKSLDSVSLRFRPKTNEVVENGRLIAGSFEGLSESERICLLGTISSSLAMKLLGLSGLMAEAAINLQDKSLIRSSVLLHVIEGFREDYRENYRYLVLIGYASNKVGVDFKSVIKAVEDLTSKHVDKILKDFMSRDDELNSLEAFGIKADVSGGVFRFVPV